MKKSIKVFVMLFVFGGFVVGALRIYGVYQTEQKTALALAAQAVERAIEKNSERTNLQVEIIQEKEHPDFSLPSKIVDCQREVRYWDSVFDLEKRYAYDRRLQTRRILHKVWVAVIGAPAETPEEQVKFLAESYPDLARAQR